MEHVVMPKNEKAGPSTNELRNKLLAGKPVHFLKKDSPRRRTIPSRWIEAAATKHAAIDLKNVVVSGALSVRVSRLKVRYR